MAYFYKRDPDALERKNDPYDLIGYSYKHHGMAPFLFSVCLFGYAVPELQEEWEVLRPFPDGFPMKTD